jgi:hypothetical protein
MMAQTAEASGIGRMRVNHGSALLIDRPGPAHDEKIARSRRCAQRAGSQVT